MANELKPRLCVMNKGENGYGFHLHGEKGKSGQYIRRVEPGSPAEASGLRAGDRVVEVNGKNVEKETHHQVSNTISPQLLLRGAFGVAFTVMQIHFHPGGLVATGKGTKLRQKRSLEFLSVIVRAPCSAGTCRVYGTSEEQDWADFEGECSFSLCMYLFVLEYKATSAQLSIHRCMNVCADGSM